MRQAAAWDVLRTFYGGKAFAPKQAKKRRFLLARRKQAFEEQVINELIAKSERGSSTPAVFAYGDGQFASSMQGCHGGTPHAHIHSALRSEEAARGTRRRVPDHEAVPHVPLL